MNERIQKLKTPEDCDRFAKNATERGYPDLALTARKRAIELKAELHGAHTLAERECLKAVYAYENVLTAKKGIRTRAARTWQMIERHGILGAVERAVKKEKETVGYTLLQSMGLQDYAFEAIVLKYPTSFSGEAVIRCEERIRQWNNP